MIESNAKSIERIIKRYIPLSLKKYILKFLLSKISGKIIQHLFSKSILGAKFNFRLVDEKSAAKIFFGIWESAEIRFAKKHVKENDIVLELGSSVGVMLSTLTSSTKIKKYIAVEASPNAINVLKETINIIGDHNILLVQAAISYAEGDFVSFSESSYTGSRLSSLSNGSGIEKIQKCPKFTLSDILINENMENTEYVLITDIEGAEADIFINDKSALQYCKKIICELDESETYSVEEQMSEIEDCGFFLKEYYGNVFVYEKRSMETKI